MNTLIIYTGFSLLSVGKRFSKSTLQPGPALTAASSLRLVIILGKASSLTYQIHGKQLANGVGAGRQLTRKASAGSLIVHVLAAICRSFIAEAMSTSTLY